MEALPIMLIVPQLIYRPAFVHEVALILKLMRTEESVLAVEGFSVEDPAIITRIIIILMKHVAGTHSVDALLAFFDGQRLMQILAKDEDLIVLGHLLEPVTIKLRRFREVPRLDRLVFEAVEH